MNYTDELWMYICNYVLQKTVSTYSMIFCAMLNKNVCCSGIKIQGDKIKVKGDIFSYTIINKSMFTSVDLLFEYAELSQIDKKNILKTFAKNYVNSMLYTDQYSIDDEYDYRAR